MNIRNTVILTLLSFACAVPTNNLKGDLKQAAFQTQVLINNDEKEVLIALAEAIVEKKIAPKGEIEKWKTLSVQLSSWNVTISRDYSGLIDNLVCKIPLQEIDNRLTQYSNDAYSKLNSDFIELKAQRYASFKIKASDIIKVARKTGDTDEIILNKFNDFVQNSDRQEMFFDRLLSYLNKTH